MTDHPKIPPLDSAEPPAVRVRRRFLGSCPSREMVRRLVAAHL